MNAQGHLIEKVNLDGPIFTMRKAVQVMLEKETKGNIVNVASIGGVSSN